MATGHETLVLTGHTGGVLGLAWSPDGKMLISGSADSKVKLWDVSNLR
ncbi:MAG: WD40 repeat domain-containing protein [Candidatus Bipolaricaulota bacterium]